MNRISAYQREQLEALKTVRAHLKRMPSDEVSALGGRINAYLAFRRDLDHFLNDHFFQICNVQCFRSQTSACCSREGIIAFFADVVVNANVASRCNPGALDRMEAKLSQPNTGPKCDFLGPKGCLWTVRPVVCAMFLCDRAKASVFTGRDDLQRQWKALRRREQRFRWPDRPVLFDDLESIFIGRGATSELMYFHNSPGLLNIKRKAGLLSCTGGAVPLHLRKPAPDGR